MRAFSFVCLFAFFSCLVFATQARFKVDFVLVDESLYPNGEIPGTVYYSYNTEAPESSKVRFEFSFTLGGKPMTIVELEDYSVSKLFKICTDKCETYPLSRTPQQWWFKTGDVKTQEVDSEGFTHYTRKFTNYGITDLWLKSENAPASPFNVKKIVFSTGRVLNFKTSTFSTSFDDSKFNPNANGVTCSNTKCSTYMDLMFVVDSSGSVGSENWKTMVKFIQDMVRQTDISAQSGAIAVSGFGGGMVKNCNCLGTLSPELFDVEGVGRWLRPQEYSGLKSTYDVYKNNDWQASCTVTQNSATSFSYSSTEPKNDNRNKICNGIIHNSHDYVSWEGWKIRNGKTELTVNGKKYNIDKLPYFRCLGNFENCSVYNGRYYSSTYVPLTYKDTDTLVNEIQQNVIYKDGGTCQALGLLEVMNQWHLSKRPSENSGAVPQRVVIVITDGDDHCAQMTQEYAKAIREQYGATLIEIGIGLETYYDKQLLENISTSFAGSPSYFDVSNYNALKQLLDQLIQEVCRTNYTENSGSCNVKCHGYCGCGHECLCPDCTLNPTTKCHSYSCNIGDDHIAGGCVDSPADCSDNLHCTEDTCDETKGCTHTPKNCSVGLKKCQVSECLEDSQGKCSTPANDNKLCPDSPYPCYRAVCDPDNEKADPVTGCYYEYDCTGNYPVEYWNGEYYRGCYEYSCNNATSQCSRKDVCQEMNENDKCHRWECSEWYGRCVSEDIVECFDGNCVLDVSCNPSTGKCDYVWKTADECREDIKEAAIDHIGTGDPDEYWFESEEEMNKFYECGVFSCDVTHGASTGISRYTAGSCVFTPSSEETCNACNGGTPGQPTFETCKDLAMQEHNKDKTKCFASTCESDGVGKSKCVATVIKTCQSESCKVVECNQTTLNCDYDWTDEYKKALAKKNACENVTCVNNKPQTTDITQEKCVGPEGKYVPVCKKFDRCDATYGCIYVDKCKKSKNCTTNVCNPADNTCVEKSVNCGSSGNICYDLQCVPSLDRCQEVAKDVEKVCGKGDRCNTITCDFLLNKCVKIQIPYPDGQDLCHNYTCDVETGNWSIVEKCDDGDICTVDACLMIDGTCTNYKRDCSELNMTGLGSCFGRSCSKLRKNGCFRKVYENSYFDECGNCIRGYTAGDSGLTDSETSNCKKALSFQEEAAILSAGILAGIILACIIGAIAVSVAGTLATKELIKRARNANMDGSQSNPLFEDDGQEMDNPTFVGDD